MRNTYVTLDALKGTGALNLTGTAYDTRLLFVLENVSREIDRYTNRQFYPISGTYFFDGEGTRELSVPDLISVGTLQEDTNEDGTFETGWAGTGRGGTDWFPMPYNAEPTADHIQKPYTKIVVNRNSAGTQDSFLRGQRNYLISGTWGYSFVTRDGGKKLTATTGSIGGSATTTLVLNATATGTGLEVGQLLYITTELMYVRGVTTGTLVDVDRGVNGFAATSHASGSAINVVQFPGPVQEAVLIQASRLWKRAESAFSSMVGLDQTGQVAVFQGGLDGDVKALLQPYRRLVA